ALLLTLPLIFRMGTDLEALERSDSSRARRLAGIAISYRDRLRKDRLLDQNETLWEASKLGPERLPVMVYGYPRLGIDEMEFLDAIAGEGSFVFLPFAEHPLFTDSRATIAFFESRGWLIESSEHGTATVGEKLSRRFLE